MQLGLAKILLPSFKVELCAARRRPILGIKVHGLELEVGASTEPLRSYVSHDIVISAHRWDKMPIHQHLESVSVTVQMQGGLWYAQYTGAGMDTERVADA